MKYQFAYMTLSCINFATSGIFVYFIAQSLFLLNKEKHIKEVRVEKNHNDDVDV